MLSLVVLHTEHSVAGQFCCTVSSLSNVSSLNPASLRSLSTLSEISFVYFDGSFDNTHKATATVEEISFMPTQQYGAGEG